MKKSYPISSEPICLVAASNFTMQNRNLIRAAALSIALSAAIGCQQSPYELAPVSGKVSIDGRPVSRAKVMFAPIEVGDSPNPGKPAFGMLQEDGSFVLTTYKPNDGAVVGEHWVTIINLARKAEEPAASGAPQNAFGRISMPHRVKVNAGVTNQIDLKLTAEDVKRFGVQIRD
jgi:hypothetical protein